MVHYVNDYFKPWGHVRELEKKVVVLQAQLGTAESAKSSIEV